MVERTVVPSDDTTSDLSLLRVINVLLAHRWLVIGLPLLFAVLFALMAIFGSQTFNATSILAPENGGSKASSAASIAASAAAIALPVSACGKAAILFTSSWCRAAKCCWASTEAISSRAHARSGLFEGGLPSCCCAASNCST